ncbi:putative Magnesium transporter MRS2-A, chloroplastic [Nannochloris sp. 'desiccata']|nr:putative Magnesium transporter MRS2-A, chloroplastic [Chlorella desiccata (nom. nud.)]
MLSSQPLALGGLGAGRMPPLSLNNGSLYGQKRTSLRKGLLLPSSYSGRDYRLGGHVMRHNNMLCRTLDTEGSFASFQPSGFNGAFNGNSNNGTGPRSSKATSGSGDTFQQLRQAVLSSLDFSENTEASQDWDEWEDSSEELGGEPQHGMPAAAGKAVFEVQRIDKQGKSRRVYVRRRDLIRTHSLQPRDLRRVDPSLSPTKTSPSVAIKEDCVLINIGGVRAVITADKCLLFEPASKSCGKFMELVLPKLQNSAAAARARAQGYVSSGSPALDSATMSMDGYSSNGDGFDSDGRVFPFELEILEGALIVATGKLEAELVAATRRVGAVLQKLPREITPVNLEELRRVKQLLVELESKAENLRDMLTELMDDEEEVIELNLSSRPKREEKRRQREIERLEREMERELTERGMMRLVDANDSSSNSISGSSATTTTGGAGGQMQQPPLQTFNSAASALASPPLPPNTSISHDSSTEGDVSYVIKPISVSNTHAAGNYTSTSNTGNGTGGTTTTNNNNEDDNIPQAQDALDEMQDKEEEERELEEVEDLLEYYLQRAATTQSEAERLLAGARDLEESIGVSLSARRFEVNRLELMLSIASFAAALGAMVASIFGMNLRSTLEMSVIGFWGTTVAIVAGSCWVFWVLYKYTKNRRIL